MIRKSILGAAAWMLAAAVMGCQSKAADRKGASEIQAIPVSQPVRREVTEYRDYTGRTEAVFSVDVRARATGHLMRRHFKDGDYVKKGDLLFEIDPRLYKAQLDQAISQVKLNEASLRLARKTYERDRVATSAVTKQQLDEDLAAVEQANERVNNARANTETLRIYLEFTRIVSPIDGQISRTYLTEGNLVNQDQTLLTTVVSVDPMYVYFDMDEPTVRQIREEVNKGNLKRMSDGSTEVHMGLQGEKGHPHPGTIDFVNNQFNSTTGSITVRGVFLNPQPSKQGERLLSPGMFARIRIPISWPSSELLVIDRAIGSDQGLKYVYVVDAANKVQYRPVITGALQPDGLRVIKQGVKPDDWVVVGGLPQIRARMEVRPDRTTMPTIFSGQSARDVLPPDRSPRKPGPARQRVQ